MTENDLNLTNINNKQLNRKTKIFYSPKETVASQKGVVS